MGHVYIKKHCILTKSDWDISAFPDVNAVQNAQENYNNIYGLNKEYYPAPYPNHKGTDYLTPAGTKVYGINGFIVNDINHKGSGLGYHIEIGNSEIAFIVAHLSKINVRKGQEVSDDLVIGLTGGIRGTEGAGITQGAHLHVQTWFNGVIYDEKKEKWVDSTPYMNGDYPMPFIEQPKYEEPVKPIDKKSLQTIADEIFYGVNGVNPWGNNTDENNNRTNNRINNLKNAGYTDAEIDEIQTLVNAKFE